MVNLRSKFKGAEESLYRGVAKGGTGMVAILVPATMAASIIGAPVSVPLGLATLGTGLGTMGVATLGLARQNKLKRVL
jgi:hypothetical protein